MHALEHNSSSTLNACYRPLELWRLTQDALRAVVLAYSHHARARRTGLTRRPRAVAGLRVAA